jgi:hypothetical protein
MKVGDKVRVMRMPDGVPPNNKQLMTLFRGCLGKDFAIAKFEDGLIVLNVGEAFGKPPEHHQIWLEPNCIRPVEA